LKKIIYYEGNASSIQELETTLQFQYLPHIAFETSPDRQDVRKRGRKKWKNNEVSLESQELGVQFIEKIEASYLPHVSVRKINELIGYGLFAEENLEANSYVGEYTGIIRKNDRRYAEPLNDYCYEYPVPDDIGRSFVIDGTQGNLTRFINHSFDPNIKPALAFYDYFYHVIFLTLRKIKKGEQLFFNYGNNYWYIRGNPSNL